MNTTLARHDDGVWIPMQDPRNPTDRVRLLKMRNHPDRRRSWSVTTIVAADLRFVKLNPVIGRNEPKSKTKEAKKYERTAAVPKSQWPKLLAAFNGGQVSTHSPYGMRLDGVTFVPPRAQCCVIAERAGGLLIRPWEKVRETEPQMKWLRQARTCMVDEGVAHPNLFSPTIGWGTSAVSGTTVIRRSAMGLNKERTVLFVGIADSVTAKAIAEAMMHAGAHYVTQLDVNHSFPKFVQYKWRDDSKTQLSAVPISTEFEFTEGQYVHDQSLRDFFYLSRREPSAK